MIGENTEITYPGKAVRIEYKNGIPYCVVCGKQI
jgi:hypothetical protein